MEGKKESLFEAGCRELEPAFIEFAGSMPPVKKKGGKKAAKEMLYCVCQKPAKDGEVMIECSAQCDGGWFHPACVELSDNEAVLDNIEYTCECCSEQQRVELARVTPVEPPQAGIDDDDL